MVDQDRLKRVRKQHIILPTLLDYLRRQKVLEYDVDHDVATFRFNLATIGRRRSSKLKRQDLEGAVSAAAALANRSQLGEAAPKLAVVLRPTRDQQGHLGLAARGRWPKEADADSRDFQKRTTAAMRIVATDLQYGRETKPNLVDYQTFLPKLVYAQVDRGTGITLQTNAAGNCSLETDPESYSPESSKYLMQGEGLISEEQQLICLAGVVALGEPILSSVRY
jgi:hypothetical protein